MNIRRVYPSLFVIGVVTFFTLLAVGGYQSVRTKGSLPPVYLNYTKDIQTTISDRKDYPRAIHQLRLAVKLDHYGQRPKHFFELAKASFRAGDRQNQQYALRSLRQMVESGTIDDPRVYYYLSVALILQDKVDQSVAREAISLCRHTLRLTPDFAPAHSNCGVALIMLGETDQALMHFRTALRLDPTLEQAQQGMQYLEKVQPPSTDVLP